LGIGSTPHHNMTLDLLCADCIKVDFDRVDARGYLEIDLQPVYAFITSRRNEPRWCDIQHFATNSYPPTLFYRGHFRCIRDYVVAHSVSLEAGFIRQVEQIIV
jgi:hypothetical protein